MNGDVLYVYYKVEAALHDHWAPLIRAFQARLVAQWSATVPGLRAELLQRPEASNGSETWMEAYAGDGELSTALVEAIAQAATSAGLPQPRHVERFIALR